MVLGLVFSKDRALQLDACLSSFALHVTDGDSVGMVIVYAASSSRYARQYQELAREHALSAEFVLEQDFRAQVIRKLRATTQVGSAAYKRAPFDRILHNPSAVKGWLADSVLFLVDDALFTGPVTLASAVHALRVNPDALGFSLRLGRNTTNCYILNREQILPPFQNVGVGVLKFDWTKADGDYGYPLEISSSLYRVSTIVGLVAGLRFSDPNTLESQLARSAKRFARTHSFMLCLETSVAFSAPLNRVQAVYENRSGDNPEWSTESLAKRWDGGYRVDVGQLDGFLPSACHQEIELSFVKAQELNVGE